MVRTADYTGQQKKTFFHGFWVKKAVSGVIRGAEHESGFRNGVSGQVFLTIGHNFRLTIGPYGKGFINFLRKFGKNGISLGINLLNTMFLVA